MINKEGVTKFIRLFQDSSSISINEIQELNSWRKVLYAYKLIGQYSEGVGYGNISQRISSPNSKLNERSFIITGSQTGHLADLNPNHYTKVHKYYPEKNIVIQSINRIDASSESMTHGTIYDCNDDIRFIFHTHSSDIWFKSKELEIPITCSNIEYGTPEMAEEVKRLFKQTNVIEKRIFSMGGHKEGIISFGKTADNAGKTLLNYLGLSQHK
jgi:L-ribulose-5-phosphate 4-epimerase